MKHPPDFLIIGAQKAGTTSLDAWLSQHPALFLPSRKELNFFALDGTRPRWNGPGDDVASSQSVWDRDEYDRLFSVAQGGVLRGESSVLYLYNSKAPERIKERCPNAKLLVTLRPPVDRAYSAFCHLRRDGREMEEDFKSAFYREEERIAAGFECLWHYRSVGFYGQQLTRYFDLFDRSQIKVISMRKLQQNPAEVFMEVCHFLDIDPEVSIDFTTIMNFSGKPQIQSLNNFLNGPGVFKSALKRVVPVHWGRRWKALIQRRNLHKFPPLNDSIRREIESIYESDQSMLARVLSQS